MKTHDGNQSAFGPETPLTEFKFTNMHVKEEGQKVGGVILLDARGQCSRNYFLWCSQLFPKEKEISA